MILTIAIAILFLCIAATIAGFATMIWLDLYERIWGSNAEFTDKLIKENEALERRLKYYEYRLGMIITSSDIQVAKKVAVEALENGKNV